MDIEKFCPRCKKTKPAKDFPKSKIRRGGLSSWCSVCSRENGKQWYASNKASKDKKNLDWYYKNKRRARNTYLKRTYGISIEEYEDLFSLQNGLCALCDQPEKTKDYRTGQIKALAVDHCHESGRIRSLLCYRCNHIISCVGDNEQGAQKILNYMKGEM